MVWYCSVRNGFQYEADWDCSDRWSWPSKENLILIAFPSEESQEAFQIALITISSGRWSQTSWIWRFSIFHVKYNPATLNQWIYLAFSQTNRNVTIYGILRNEFNSLDFHLSHKNAIAPAWWKTMQNSNGYLRVPKWSLSALLIND